MKQNNKKKCWMIEVDYIDLENNLLISQRNECRKKKEQSEAEVSIEIKEAFTSWQSLSNLQFLVL